MPLAVVYALATQLAYLSRLEAPTTVMGGGDSPKTATPDGMPVFHKQLSINILLK